MVYKDLLQELAVQMFNSDIKYSQLTQEVYNTVNVLLFKNHPILNIYEKKVNKAILYRYDNNTYPDYLSRLLYKYRFKQNKSFILDIDLTLIQHEYIPYSCIKLLELFGENIMKIFDALLREQRVIYIQILVSSGGKKAFEVGFITSSIAHLITPPIPYIIENHLFPYANLNDMGFLNT